MVDEKLLNWITSQLSNGLSLEQIKQTLLTQGWQASDIDNAINFANQKGKNSANGNQEPKKKSKLVLIIIIFSVIVILVLSLFFILGKKNVVNNSVPITSNFIDCGNNFNCFISASQQCSPSNLTNTATWEIFTINETSTSYYEIKGIEQNKCIFYLQIKKINITFPPGTSQETINQEQQIYPNLEGRDGTCGFNTGDLTALLRRWKDGNVSSEDFNLANCSGSYFNSSGTTSVDYTAPGVNVTITQG